VRSFILAQEGPLQPFQLSCLEVKHNLNPFPYTEKRTANFTYWLTGSFLKFSVLGSHVRQKPQAPTPQAPIRNRLTRKVANAEVLNRNTNLTKPNLT